MKSGDRKIIDQWQRTLLAEGRPKDSCYLYRRYVERFVEFAHRVDVPTDKIEKWMAEQHWSSRTRRSAVSALRSFYSWAYRRGRTSCDPSLDLKRPPQRRSTPKPTPAALLADALAVQPGETYWLLRLASDTGLRRAELASLHSSMVQGVSGGFWLRVTGKGDKTRLVPVPDDIARWLLGQGGWAFPSPVFLGEPVRPDAIGKRIKRALGGPSAHTLRHFYATRAYQATGDIHAVQALLGHASPDTTQGYVQMEAERLRRVAERSWAA